jgi:hypothetical protein
MDTERARTGADARGLSGPSVHGEMLQCDSPSWDPLLKVAPELVEHFMWMLEVETQDGRRPRGLGLDSGRAGSRLAVVFRRRASRAGVLWVIFLNPQARNQDRDVPVGGGSRAGEGRLSLEKNRGRKVPGAGVLALVVRSSRHDRDSRRRWPVGRSGAVLGSRRVRTPRRTQVRSGIRSASHDRWPLYAGPLRASDGRRERDGCRT